MIISTPRVTQLDAFLLDNELISRLLEQLSSTASSEYKSELSLLLRVILYKMTLWDKNQSYGMFLMNLKYEDLHKVKKAAYYTWCVLSGYLNDKVSARVYEDDEGQSWKKAWKFGEKLVKVSEFVNFLMFLVKGDYPLLALRLLRVKISVNSIELAKANKGNVSYEFQNRQLVWNTFLEFIIFILPLFQNSGINSIFSKLLQKPSKVQDQLEYKHLKERQCAICFESGNKQRITTPYRASCGCLYCYVCIVTKMEQSKTIGEKWRCLKCGEEVVYAKPFDDIDKKAIKIDIPVVEDDSDYEEEVEKVGDEDVDDDENEDEYVDDENEDEDEDDEDQDDDNFEQDEFDEIDEIDDMYEDDL